MSETFIQQSFIHVGESKTQKSIVSGLHRVIEMDKVIYHGFAWADDNRSIYIMSKQRASQKHDEKTRNKTDAGERPNFSEYLVMAQLSVIATTEQSNGHTLGLCGHVMRSYCAMCKAGVGMCYHRGSLLWMQLNHWGEGRPTPKPATVDFCSWVPGSKRTQRSCSVLEPTTKLNIQQLPKSTADAKLMLEKGKKRGLHEGISAVYDVYGGDNVKT